jgi:hypothetical protein
VDYLFSILAFLALVLLIAGVAKPGKNKQTGKQFKRKNIAVGFGLVFIVFAVLASVTAPKTKPLDSVDTSNSNNTPAAIKSSSSTPIAKATTKVVATSTPTPVATSTPSPVVLSAPTLTPSPAQQATSSCTPLTDSGGCYEPGEYCRDDDQGTTGVAGDGETITCEDNNGWRWEPS